MDLSSKMADRLGAVGLDYFRNRTAGDLVERFADAVIVSGLVGSIIIDLLLSISLLAGFLIYIAFTGNNIWMPVVSGLYIFALGTVLAMRLLHKYLWASRIRSSEASSWLYSGIGGIESILSLDAYSFWRKEFLGRQELAIRSGFQSQFIGSIYSSAAPLITTAVAAIAMLLSDLNFADRSESAGVVVGSFYLVSYVFSPANSLGQIWMATNELDVSLARISDILDAPDVVRPSVSNGGVSPITMSHEIPVLVAEGVRICYRADRPLVDSFSFVLRKDEHVALAGPSGSGKSSIARVLAGLELSDAGSVELFPELHDLRNFPIIYVTQNIDLFPDSLETNIRFGAPGVELADIDAAIGVCDLGSLVERLPAGLNSVISENSRNISGGERQRIGLARALVRKPAILILDEVTSGLDRQTALGIFFRLREIRGMACVWVTHSDQILERCDRVVHL